MAIKSATPYFLLKGRTEQAIALYQKAFGARTEALQRFGDVDQSCPASDRNRIMHVELRVGDALLMMSDSTTNEPLNGGGDISVALAFDDEAELRRSFDTLAASGKVMEPLFNAPWGGLFGVVRDAFGIHWMFNSTTKPQ